MSAKHGLAGEQQQEWQQLPTVHTCSTVQSISRLSHPDRIAFEVLYMRDNKREEQEHHITSLHVPRISQACGVAGFVQLHSCPS